MNNDIGRAIGVVIASAFGLALVSVIFSSRSQTATVIGAGGNALSTVISAAVAPVTGQTPQTVSTASAASSAGSSILSGFGNFLGGAAQGAVDTGSFSF